MSDFGRDLIVESSELFMSGGLTASCLVIDDGDERVPYYDYMCDDCGPFREKRPMAEAALPQPCPMCAASAQRAILQAPRLSGMSGERRSAFATNERSAHEPRSLRSGAHGAGCGCCAGPKLSAKATTPAAAKSFPSARPWMISH